MAQPTSTDQDNWDRSEGDPCPRCGKPTLRMVPDDDGARVCGDCSRTKSKVREVVRSLHERWLQGGRSRRLR